MAIPSNLNLSFDLTTAPQVGPGIYQTHISGLWYVAPKSFADQRGFYSELSRVPELEAVLGKPFAIKQINHSHSVDRVIRGFHAENWDKLITVISGTTFCALADVRPASATFGQVETFLLGFDQPAIAGSLLITAGIANSFCVLQGPVNYVYSVNELYANRDPQGDVAISLFDPDLAVQWPLEREQLVISDRDAQAVSLRQRFPEKFTV